MPAVISNENDLIRQNNDDISNIVNAVRENHISGGGSARLKALVEAFTARNTVGDSLLRCREDSYTRFRVRFFDFVGRVWEWDSVERKLSMRDFEFENDTRVASWWDPRRKATSPGAPEIPTSYCESGLCLLLGHGGKLESPRFPHTVIEFPEQAVTSLNTSEEFFAKWIASSGTEALERWQRYLRDILHLSLASDEMTANTMALVFRKSLAQNQLDAVEHGINLASSYAYVLPCVTANEVVCLLTLRTRSPLVEADILHMEKIVLPAFANLSLLLSARIMKAHTRESGQDLAHTYSRTQSDVIWNAQQKYLDAQKKDPSLSFPVWYETETVRGFFGGLPGLKRQLTDELSVPVGDREIAKTIRDSFLKEALARVFPETSGPSGRLLTLLDSALDDEDVLRGIPRYRQHFIHSFHVFLAGLRILVEPPQEGARAPISLLVDRMNLSQDDLLKAWFCAAIFHDISYSVANVEEWVGLFLDRVILGATRTDNADTERARAEGHATGARGEGGLQEQWVLNQIARLFRFENYQDSLTRLVNIMADCSSITGRATRDLSNEIYTMLLGTSSGRFPIKSDHGILSSLMFLNAFERDLLNPSKPNFVLHAADAIAHHSDPMPIVNKLGQLYKNRNPFRDLLIICDHIQEWGRTESDDSLACFNMVIDKWDWKEDNAAGDQLDIILRYRRPIEPRRRDEAAAKAFYWDKWKPGKSTGIEGRIGGLIRHFHSPFGNIKLDVIFDGRYIGEESLEISRSTTFHPG